MGERGFPASSQHICVFAGASREPRSAEGLPALPDQTHDRMQEFRLVKNTEILKNANDQGNDFNSLD